MPCRTSRRKTKSPVLSVAERPKSLAFSQHRFLSLRCPSETRSNSYVESEIDVDIRARPRQKFIVPLKAVDDPKIENSLPIWQNVCSLITLVAPVTRITRRRLKSSLILLCYSHLACKGVEKRIFSKLQLWRPCQLSCWKIYVSSFRSGYF